MAPVISTSRVGLLARRKAILGRLELDEHEFSERLSLHSPTADEWEAKEELDAIAFLLGEDRSDE